MSEKKYIIVLCRVPFYALPLRRTVKNHLYCFEHCGSYPVIFINVDYGIPIFLLKKMQIKAVIFHTSFLVMRWTPRLFEKKTKNADFFKRLSCPKIALPQDEFIHTQLLMTFFQAVNISHVYSCAAETEWDNIYPGLKERGVKFHTVLTGYIDEEDIQIAAHSINFQERSIDIGYRTQHMPAWLGQHGALKIQIAEKTKEIAASLGLKIDISTELKDVLPGPKWLAFLGICRAVIGVEGGASILDRDGSLREKIEQIEHTTQEPERSRLCEEILKDYEGNLNLKALSPRHFEACLTRTYQILVEGDYNGILKPHVHYFPVKKDFSNLQQALESLKDPAHVQKITEKAYQDIVGSGQYTYKKFVEFMETTALDGAPEACPEGSWGAFAVLILKMRNFFWEGVNRLCGVFFRCFPLKAKEQMLLLLKRIFHQLA